VGLSGAHDVVLWAGNPTISKNRHSWITREASTAHVVARDRHNLSMIERDNFCATISQRCEPRHALANSARYDPANYRGVYASLAQNTNVFSAGAARAAGDFFKGDAAGIKKS